MIFLYFLGIIVSVLAWWAIGFIIMAVGCRIIDGKLTLGMIDNNFLSLSWIGPLLLPILIISGIGLYISDKLEHLTNKWNNYIKNNADKQIW